MEREAGVPQRRRDGWHQRCQAAKRRDQRKVIHKRHNHSQETLGGEPIPRNNNEDPGGKEIKRESVSAYTTLAPRAETAEAAACKEAAPARTIAA